MTTGPTRLEEIQALETPDLINRYRNGTNRLDRRILGLSDDQLDTAFLPTTSVGRWPCRVLVGHLADAELAYVHRFRRVVAEERPVFAAWDENAFIDSGLYRGHDPKVPLPVAGSVAVIHSLRLWTAEWLATNEASAWSRAGLHPEYGEMPLRLLLDYATWHLEHHAWFLEKKLDKLLAES